MVEKSNFEGILLLSVREGIDHSEMVDIRNAISDLIREGRASVIISVKDVKYINYLSVAVLVERLTRLRGHGGDLKFVGMNDYLRKEFRLIGIAEAFENFESVDEAKKSFSEYPTMASRVN